MITITWVAGGRVVVAGVDAAGEAICPTLDVKSPSLAKCVFDLYLGPKSKFRRNANMNFHL